jgi:hypothetical protein
MKGFDALGTRVQFAPLPLHRERGLGRAEFAKYKHIILCNVDRGHAVARSLVKPRALRASVGSTEAPRKQLRGSTLRYTPGTIDVAQGALPLIPVRIGADPGGDSAERLCPGGNSPARNSGDTRSARIPPPLDPTGRRSRPLGMPLTRRSPTGRPSRGANGEAGSGPKPFVSAPEGWRLSVAPVEPMISAGLLPSSTPAAQRATQPSTQSAATGVQYERDSDPAAPMGRSDSTYQNAPVSSDRRAQRGSRLVG